MSHCAYRFAFDAAFREECVGLAQFCKLNLHAVKNSFRGFN